jgi:hypothetical protein
MSGLLHRLAERALSGTAPRVRSVAPVPWLAMPEIVEAAEPAALAPASAVPQPPTAKPFAPEAPGAALDHPLDAASPKPAVVPAATAAATEHEEAEAPAPPALGVEPRQPSATTADTPAVQHNLSAPTASPQTLTATVAALSNSVRARNLPGPLLAPPTDVHADPVGARTGLHVAVAAVDSEPATEVHVHIGRVELTAIAESPPPQRKTQSASTGRSLDAYLQQRKDRRR